MRITDTSRRVWIRALECGNRVAVRKKECSFAIKATNGHRKYVGL
jgi:hypothetical protein